MAETLIISNTPPPDAVRQALANEGIDGEWITGFEGLGSSVAPETRLLVVLTGDESAVKQVPRLRKLGPDLEILLLCDSNLLPTVRDLLGLTPGIGRFVRCAAVDADAAQAVSRSAQRARSRARNRRQLNALNSELSTLDPFNHTIRQTLDGMLEHAPLGVVLLNTSGQVLACNKAATLLLNRSAHDTTGHAGTDVFGQDFPTVTPRSLPVEFELQGPGGTEQRLWFKVASWEPDGAAPVVVVFFDDVTERRRLEARLRRTQRLQSLGLMASGVAHDFNNLMTSVLGHLDLAQAELPEGHSAGELLEHVAEGVMQCTDLCQQLLAYAGRSQPKLTKLDVRELIATMSKLLHVSLPEGVTLEYSSASDIPNVEADATQLRQVFMNLLSNAAQSMEDRGGVVRVEVDCVELSRTALDEAINGEPLAEGRFVVVSVSDTGCGMSTATLDRIFDPFFTTKSGGHGLGLAAVMGTLRSHRGALRVQSVEGVGTTFQVLLPIGSGDHSTLQSKLEPETSPAPLDARGRGDAESSLPNRRVNFGRRWNTSRRVPVGPFQRRRAALVRSNTVASSRPDRLS